MIAERHRFALALIALLASILFLPSLVTGDVFTLRDHFDYFQPLRWFTAQELSAGHLPFWNPYNASGEPWLANPQTGVFYPPTWLFLALPFATAFQLYLLLHLLLLGCGAYLLFARRASSGAALIGAIAFMFSGPVLSLLDVQNNLATLAWIPLVLWCAAEGAWRRGGLALAAAFLAGEPFFAALAALLYVCVRRKRDVIGTALIAFGASAIQLLPFLEFVAHSDRAGGMEDALVLRDSMPLADWLRIALPPSIASPSLAHPSQQFIPVIYTGVIVLALALLGATTLRRNIATRGWIALLAFAIVVSTGPSLLTRLPLTVFRYPARLVPIGVLALAALAVAGWERVRTNRRWVDLLLVLIVASDLLLRAAPLLRTAPFRTDVVPYAREIGARGKLLRFGDIDPLQRANWISGYLNLYDRRFDTFTAAPLASEAYVRMYRELLIAPTFAKFSYAGVVFILTTYELPHPWVHVTHANDVHVFRNREAYPMAAHFAPGLRSVRHASWSLDTSHARISVNAPRDGVLVLRQQTARGWKVRVDGRPAEALVIDGLFRGVRVTRGHHDVEWTYDPPFFLPGAAMTIVTLLTLQIAVFVKHSKARRKKSFSSCPSNLE